MISAPAFTAAVSAAKAHTGESLDALSRVAPRLVVFLRHSGCPFCKETLALLQQQRQAIEAAGTRIVLVHMMPDDEAAEMFGGYGLDDVARISDPERKLYEAFELKRGGVSQVMGPRVWWQGFKTTILKGHLPGAPGGDVFQLPGAFLVKEGELLRAFRPDTSAEHPDYTELAACPVTGEK